MTDANTMVEELEIFALDDCAGQYVERHLCNLAAALIRSQQEEVAVLKKVIDQIIEQTNSGGTGVRKVMDIRNIAIRAPRLPDVRRER